MRVIIYDGELSKRILMHLGLPAQAPAAWPARAQPTPLPGSSAAFVLDSIDDSPERSMDPDSGYLARVARQTVNQARATATRNDDRAVTRPLNIWAGAYLVPVPVSAPAVRPSSPSTALIKLTPTIDRPELTPQDKQRLAGTAQ